MATLTVFGLGEAGRAISADLAAAGHAVSGFDPAPVPTPEGVTRHDDPRTAVDGADLVMAITAASDAPEALRQALSDIPAGAAYADLSTGPPDLKRDLCRAAQAVGLRFADVALMSTVPDNGARTPALVSGPGSTMFFELMSALGMPVEVVGPDAGSAATRKLLRSITIKGFAAVVIESMRAANGAGLGDETWADLVAQFTAADEEFLRHMVEGTELHAERRLHEMEAAGQLLEELGFDAVMTRATTKFLRRVPSESVPRLPAVRDEGSRQPKS